MNTSKLIVTSTLAGFSIIAINASVTLAGRIKPVSATGGAHGAGVLILKTNSNQVDPNLSSRGLDGKAVVMHDGQKMESK